MDEDSDAQDVVHVSQRSRRRSRRFAVLTESDNESDPLTRPTGQTRNEDYVITVPASSGAVAAHLGAIGGDARQVEFDMTLTDADTENLSTHSSGQIEHRPKQDEQDQGETSAVLLG